MDKNAIDVIHHLHKTQLKVSDKVHIPRKGFDCFLGSENALLGFVVGVDMVIKCWGAKRVKLTAGSHQTRDASVVQVMVYEAIDHFWDLEEPRCRWGGLHCETAERASCCRYDCSGVVAVVETRVVALTLQQIETIADSRSEVTLDGDEEVACV